MAIPINSTQPIDMANPNRPWRPRSQWDEIVGQVYGKQVPPPGPPGVTPQLPSQPILPPPPPPRRPVDPAMPQVAPAPPQLPTTVNQAPAPEAIVERPQVAPRPMGSAAQGYLDALGHRPQMEKPSLWRNLAAAALSGAAGAINAGGRVRIPMPDTHGILHPGYERDMQNWHGELATAKAGMDVEQAQDAMGVKRIELGLREKESDARIAQANAAAGASTARQNVAEKQLNETKDPTLVPTEVEINGKVTPALLHKETGRYRTLAGDAIEPTSITRINPQEPEAPKSPSLAQQDRDLALQRYANKAGKKVEDLTPDDKVAAIREFATDTKPPEKQSADTTQDDADAIAEAIIRGDQPPDMKGLYRMGAPVRSALAKKGYSLTTAQRDWQAVQRHIAALNGAQQERLRQAITFTHDSLDIIDDLYDDWQKVAKPSDYKILNKVKLAAARQLPGEAGAIAQALDAQINDLISELGTVYKGGNSSTDESLRLASQNLAADWNEAQFKKQMDLIRKNLTIRKNSILNSQPVGVTPGSPYASPAPEQQEGVVEWEKGPDGKPRPIKR